MAKFGSSDGAQTRTATRNRPRISTSSPRVVLESFQRTCRRLLERTIQLLDRAARFSKLGAHGRCSGFHRLQHVLLVVRLNLRSSECGATLTGDRLERDDVVLTETVDRAANRRRGCIAHADVVRDLVGDARSGRQAHQPQVLLHLRVVHDFQKGRLFKLDGQPLAKRPVKHGVTCRVGAIGHDNRVRVRELGVTVHVQVPGDEDRQHSRSRHSQFPACGVVATPQASRVRSSAPSLGPASDAGGRCGSPTPAGSAGRDLFRGTCR